MEQTDLTHLKATLKARAICVVIPTYNHGATIGRVVSDVLRYCDDVIVVNDGSTDQTSLTLHQFDGITLIEYDVNRGKGYALKQGFRKALSMGFAYAITLDSDGQHFASDIPLFLRANQQHPGALIVGARQLAHVDRSKGSAFANQFSNFWFYVQTGRRLADTQTGYRLYPLKKLLWLPLVTSRYEAELALMVFASWHGVDLQSIPVNVYYPPREERVSHFRPGRDFARISLLNTVLCLLAVVCGLPLRVGRWLMQAGRTLFALLFFSVLMFLVITPVSWVYVKIGRMTDHKRDRLRRLICRFSQWVMLRVGIPGTTFTYKICEDVTFDKPRVIVCNHQSHLDLMCQLIFTPNMIFLTNDWVWNNPFYGFLIRAAEYYPTHEGIDHLLPKLKSLAERGCSIAVFPEGTRSADCSIGRFHQGVFYIADQLGLDLLPMCLYGPGRVLPKKSHMLRRAPVYIEVGSPVSLQTLRSIGSYRAQASWLRRRYQEEYERISNEIEQYV